MQDVTKHQSRVLEQVCDVFGFFFFSFFFCSLAALPNQKIQEMIYI